MWDVYLHSTLNALWGATIEIIEILYDSACFVVLRLKSILRPSLLHVNLKSHFPSSKAVQQKVGNVIYFSNLLQTTNDVLCFFFFLNVNSNSHAELSEPSGGGNEPSFDFRFMSSSFESFSCLKSWKETKNVFYSWSNLGSNETSLDKFSVEKLFLNTNFIYLLLLLFSLLLRNNSRGDDLNCWKMVPENNELIWET